MIDKPALFKAHSVARRVHHLRGVLDTTSTSQPMSSVQRWLDCYANRGADVDAILRDARLLSRLAINGVEDERNSDSILQYYIYRLLLQQLPNDPVLIESGAGITEPYFRMMCYCILPCKDLGSALHRASEYCRLLGEPVSQIALVVSQHTASFHLALTRIPAAESPKLRLSVSASAMAVWHQFIGWLVGEKIDLLKVGFNAERMEDMRFEKYARVFDCPIDANAREHCLVFPASYLDYPLQQDEDSLHTLLKTAPHELMSFSREGLVPAIKRMMGKDFRRNKLPGFDEVAARFNVSESTLRRTLKSLNTSFRELRNEALKSIAHEKLKDPDLSIVEIGESLGFSSVSSFHRSFKHWTGLTPAAYRKVASCDHGASLHPGDSLPPENVNSIDRLGDCRG